MTTLEQQVTALRLQNVLQIKKNKQTAENNKNQKQYQSL